MNKLITVLFLAAAACGRNDQSTTAAQSPTQPPRTTVDSILPVEEQIRRFKAERGNASAATLSNGALSHAVLVQRFITALERADTAALRSMVLNAGEFIDLYYPSSKFAHPPYKQSPELRWFLVQQNSNKGLTRLLQRYGGKPSRFQEYDCADQPVIEGDNRIWDRCRLTWGWSASPMRAFSTIIERGGRFKIFSYANDL